MSRSRHNSHRNLFQKTRLKNKNSEVTQNIIDIQKLWNEKADSVPIIIDALFTIKKNFEKLMKKLNIPIALPCLLKATLFRTAFVLRRLGISNVKAKKNQKKPRKIIKSNNNYTINK